MFLKLPFAVSFSVLYIYIYIYILSRRSITPQHIKYDSMSLYVVQSLYFGSKLPSSGTYNSGHCIYSIGLKCFLNCLSLFHFVF